MIKQDKGKRYVYYDSKMAKGEVAETHTFAPMSKAFLIDDEKTSPILHTIYRPFDKTSDDEEDWSDPIFIAVNDQPSQKKRDAFKKSVSSNSGHAKFFTSSQVKFNVDGEKDKVEIYSYLIQHSLPKFPNIEFSKKPTHGAIFANALPKEKSSIFDKNLGAKGQHFFCTSFIDEQKLDKKPKSEPRDKTIRQLEYDRVKLPEYLSSRNHNFLTILHYLKVVHGAVVATNYNPFDKKMSVYHKYLNVYENWSETETKEQKSEKNRNMARTSTAADIDSDHLCPLFPLKRCVRLNKEGDVIGHKYYDQHFSMRSSDDANQGVCTAWSIHHPQNNLCLASAAMKTSAMHYPLEFTLFMKGRSVDLGLYDDILAFMAVFKEDFTVSEDEDTLKIDMNLGLITQTWIDSATLPRNSKKLLPGSSSLNVKLDIENSTSITLPQSDGIGYELSSRGQDHSKWALLVPRGTAGTFPNLFCTCDLNRTHVQEGRGGGALCVSDSIFTQLMLSLKPTVSDEFLDKNIQYSKLKHLYANTKQSAVTAIAMDNPESRSDVESSSVEEDEPSSAFFLATQYKTQKLHISRMPYPYKLHPLKGSAVPRLLNGVDEISEKDKIVLVGDVVFDEQKQRKASLTKDIEPYRQAVLSSFKTGPYMLMPGEEGLKSVDGELKMPMNLWTRIQQALHKISGKNLSFTTRWLLDYLKPEEKPTELKKKTLKSQETKRR